LGKGGAECGKKIEENSARQSASAPGKTDRSSLLNDKKSLFMGGTIIEVALCVNEKTSQHMVVLGDSMARRFVNNARAEQGVAFNMLQCVRDRLD